MFILDFVHVVIDSLLALLFWLVIANAVMSWLIAFDIVNLRNRMAYNVVTTLDRVVAPFLAPFRRFIPPIGGLDITPVILLILISAVRHPLLDGLFVWLGGVLGLGVNV